MTSSTSCGRRHGTQRYWEEVRNDEVSWRDRHTPVCHVRHHADRFSRVVCPRDEWSRWTGRAGEAEKGHHRSVGRSGGSMPYQHVAVRPGEKERKGDVGHQDEWRLRLRDRNQVRQGGWRSAGGELLSEKQNQDRV